MSLAFRCGCSWKRRCCAWSHLLVSCAIFLPVDALAVPLIPPSFDTRPHSTNHFTKYTDHSLSLSPSSFFGSRPRVTMRLTWPTAGLGRCRHAFMCWELNVLIVGHGRRHHGDARRCPDMSPRYPLDGVPNHVFGGGGERRTPVRKSVIARIRPRSAGPREARRRPKILSVDAPIPTHTGVTTWGLSCAVARRGLCLSVRPCPSFYLLMCKTDGVKMRRAGSSLTRWVLR